MKAFKFPLLTDKWIITFLIGVLGLTFFFVLLGSDLGKNVAENFKCMMQALKSNS